MLDKKAVLTRKNIKAICLTKILLLKVIKIAGGFFIVITITVFFIINSRNKELIHHIRCSGCISNHQSKIKKCGLFHRFLFYDLYLEYYSLNASNIFIFVMTYCCNNISIHTFCFLVLTIIISTNYEYIFRFNLTSSSMAT